MKSWTMSRSRSRLSPSSFTTALDETILRRSGDNLLLDNELLWYRGVEICCVVQR